MGPFYLMESEAETNRLLIKNYHEKTARQLIDTGIQSLPKGSHLVDAGCGIGHVAEMMGGILRDSFERPAITLLDLSKTRLSTAQSRLDGDPNVDYRYLSCDLTRHIPLPSHSVDFAVCRFVFEYLADPQAAFDELYRILKPGGKLVVGDLDYNCMTHYPLDPRLEADLSSLVGTLQENRLFDPYAGRKIYSFFHRARLEGIRVHFYDHHLFYGDLAPTDEFNWLAKIDRLIEHQKEGTIRFPFDLTDFKRKFFEFLRSPGRFSYTPLILVEGRRPE